MVNSRLRLVKSEDNQKTDMQIAVEEIMGDRATTPTMKKRKVDVLSFPTLPPLLYQVFRSEKKRHELASHLNL